VLTVGTGFAWFFWNQMAGPATVAQPFVRDAPANLGGEAGGLSGFAPEPTPAPTPLRPPEAILWLNPVVAAADVVCGMDVNPYSIACQLVSQVTGKVPGGDQAQIGGPIPMPAPMAGGGVAAPDVIVKGGEVNVVDSTLVATDDPFASSSTRDTFWPRAAAAWLAMSLVLVVLAVQMVSPTRRWRVFRRRGRHGARE